MHCRNLTILTCSVFLVSFILKILTFINFIIIICFKQEWFFLFANGSVSYLVFFWRVNSLQYIPKIVINTASLSLYILLWKITKMRLSNIVSRLTLFFIKSITSVNFMFCFTVMAFQHVCKVRSCFKFEKTISYLERNTASTAIKIQWKEVISQRGILCLFL